ncbi:C-C chemokine receptor type 10 [Bombina bombina]|uniref:C-C chemokine receptor type 10 n=1 Tax=Bombina bombina TaxID=8345 RepID=UPI00235B0487|nr:C-C chemokine receptor type 10 [Bombina bombina]
MLGNALVLLTYGFTRKIKSMTDVYIINLAVADILLLTTIPFVATDAVSGWVFGNAMCKCVQGLHSIDFYSGFIFLTCISVDRYIEIVQAVEAHKMRHRTIHYSKWVSIMVWIGSILLTTPQFIYSKSVLKEGWYICKMIFPENVTTTVKGISNFSQIILGFVIPFFVMVFCYSVIVKTLMSSRSFEKHKALKVIFSLVIVFVVFQFPYSLVTLLETTDLLGSKQMPCMESRHKNIALIVTSSLAYIRCCLNPILYAFVGVRFRKDVLTLLKNIGCISWTRHIKYCSSVKPRQNPAAMDTSSFYL